jgi:hypothetical protein
MHVKANNNFELFLIQIQEYLQIVKYGIFYDL